MNHRPAVLVLFAVLTLALAGAVHAQAADAPPTIPGNPVVTVYSPTFVTVSWQRSTDDRGAIAGYEVLRDEVSLGTFDSLSYVDRDLSPGTSYNYVILAIDSAGQRSLRATVRTVTPDAVPAPPAGVRGIVYSRTAAELFWERSTVFGQRYEVKRDGVVMTTTHGTGYFDDTLTAARPYLFEVISLNRQGQRSSSVRLFIDTSELGSAPTTPIPTGTASPTGLRTSVYSRSAAEVFWERPSTTGLIYEVRRDGELLVTTDGTSWFDDALTGGMSYTYEIFTIDPEGRRSTPSSVMLSTPGDSMSPLPEVSVISIDNHIELLKYLFDIYTGNAYGLAVINLPGYSATPEGPSGPGPGLGDSFVVTQTCSNGGTANFDRIRWGSFGETVGWVYDFVDCQDGTDVLDGVLSSADNSSIRFLSSPGFTVDKPIGPVHFRGNVERLYRNLRGLGEGRYWLTTADAPDFTPNAYDATAGGVDFVLSDADGNTTFELLEARTYFGHNLPISMQLSGGYSIRSEATGGERLEVKTLEPFYHDGFSYLEGPDGSLPEYPDFDTGMLRVSAANGDTLLLDAANGDHDTVQIEISVNGVTETLTQPWSLWREQIKFSAEFLGEL